MMSLETEGSSPTATESASATEANETTTFTTGYSATDPGYDSVEPTEDDLSALIAENTKKKPSETSDDASETKGDADESVETPAGDEAAEDLEISDDLLDRAVAVGYDLDEIREFKDAKALDKELTRVEKLAKRLQGVKEAKSPPEPEQKPESEEPNWDQMIEDGHDPDVIALQKSSWQRAAAAEAMVKQLQQVELQRAAQAESDQFDDTLNSLGEEYAPILGKGRLADLTKSSPEAAANRQKVYSMMEVLRNGYRQSGQTVPKTSELVQQAFQAAFAKQSQEIARTSLKKQLKKAGSQALSRPRSGSSIELPGPDRALQKEREFWKNFNG